MLEKIIQFLTELFSQFKITPMDSKPTATTPKSRNERVLSFASQEIGVKEVSGDASNPQIVKYHAYARVDNDITKGQPDSVAWCSSFVCYCLEMVGMGSTNAMNARSYLKWGKSSKADPIAGDIIVFWRGSPTSWMGHVGFYVGETATHYLVLGGNQSNAVNVSLYHKSTMLDIRRSSKHEKLTPEVKENLAKIAFTIRTHGPSDLYGNPI